MRQSVEKGTRQALRAEGLGPSVERQFAGDQRGPALIALGNQFEQQRGAGLGQRAQRDAGNRLRSPLGTPNLNTVVGKPGAVQRFVMTGRCEAALPASTRFLQTAPPKPARQSRITLRLYSVFCREGSADMDSSGILTGLSAEPFGGNRSRSVNTLSTV